MSNRKKIYQKRQYYEIFDQKTPTTVTLCSVHVTLFHGMLLQKRKQFLDIFSFEYGATSIKEKKTFSVIFVISKQNSPKTFHLQ